MRRLLLKAAAAAALLALGGCAAINSLPVQVSTFGEWPAGRAPGRYAFERLPSQEAQADQQQRLEDAAAPALARAGFSPVANGETPDLLVQVGFTQQPQRPGGVGRPLLVARWLRLRPPWALARADVELRPEHRLPLQPIGGT